MSMNIKNPEAHRLARELAELDQTTVTEAVTEALRQTLADHQARASVEVKAGRLRAISERSAAALASTPGPSLWDANAELFDQSGLPR